MASYPGSVKTFASLSNGATIQATDVSDARDEITAIEAGLLQGTAPLNSSHSTLATLSVTGGSTLAGAVTFGAGVASTVSFASSVTFLGDVTVVGALTATLSQSFPSVTLNHSVSQGVPNAGASYTGLSWDTEVHDAYGMHSTSVNSSRITFAHSTGIYLVGASAEWSSVAGAATARFLKVVLNDATDVAGSYAVTATDPTRIIQCATSQIRVQSTSDYVTSLVYQTSGSTASVRASTAGVVNFWAHKVSNA